MCDNLPWGTLRRAGYRAARDTVRRGIPVLQACRKVLMLSESEFSLECIDQARSLSVAQHTSCLAAYLSISSGASPGNGLARARTGRFREATTL